MLILIYFYSFANQLFLKNFIFQYMLSVILYKRKSA